MEHHVLGSDFHRKFNNVSHNVVYELFFKRKLNDGGFTFYISSVDKMTAEYFYFIYQIIIQID